MRQPGKKALLKVILSVFFITALAATGAMAAGPGVNVTVEISPKLKARTSPDQVVFIFAKAVRGPRAPLAAVKARVGDLPMTVRLDDTKAAAPMFRISRFSDVTVSARVSKSGQAMRTSGDLEGVVPSAKVGSAKPVRVVIDKVVP